MNKVCGLAAGEADLRGAVEDPHAELRRPVRQDLRRQQAGLPDRGGKDDTARLPRRLRHGLRPATDKAENLGMPFKGEGVIDVTADEKAGLVYVVTCEDQHWMILDMKTKKYREPDTDLRLTPYAQTLIDHKGRGGRRHAGFQARPLRPRERPETRVPRTRFRRQAGRQGGRQTRPRVLGHHR